MTYTRLQAAELVGTSNRSISNWLKEFDAVHGLGEMLENDRITDFGLERLHERAELGAAGYRQKYAPAEAPTATVEAAPAGSIVTMADRCGEIAANVSQIEVMDATPYEQRASNARSALAKFVEARNARSQSLARNAAAKRRSIEQIAAEHAIGDLMTYSDIYDRVLAEGMQATQGASVAGLDAMGKPAAAG